MRSHQFAGAAPSLAARGGAGIGKLKRRDPDEIMQALVLLLGSAGGAALAPSASSLRPVIYASVRAAPEISSRALRMRGGGKQGDTPVRWRALGAEAIGTGMITGLGTGVASAATYCAAQSGLWQIAAATGAAVTLSVYTTAAISGAHLNPAVTIALAAYRSFPRAHIAAYIAAQCVGASVGALLNYMCFTRAISAFEASRGLVRGTPAALASAPGCLFFHLGPVRTATLIGPSFREYASDSALSPCRRV